MPTVPHSTPMPAANSPLLTEDPPIEPSSTMPQMPIAAISKGPMRSTISASGCTSTNSTM